MIKNIIYYKLHFNTFTIKAGIDVKIIQILRIVYLCNSDTIQTHKF